MSIRVLIADDHAVVRRGLTFYLNAQSDIEIVGEAGNGREAIEATAKLAPDVVLMDLKMPEMDGIEATRRIRGQYPDVKVIVLTTFGDQGHVLPAVKAGANGYLLKDAEPDELLKAIRSTAGGGTYLHPEVTGHLMAHISGNGEAGAGSSSGNGDIEPLTQREREVLALIARGRSNKEIAADIHIAEKTVKTHVSHILAKLNVADRTQAAIYAVKRGWDAIPDSSQSDE